MSNTLLALIVLALGAIGYVIGRQRALKATDGDQRKLHSLPSYYGTNVLLKTMVPAFLLMLVWLLAQPIVVDRSVRAGLQDESVRQDRSVSLVMTDVRRVANGLGIAVEQGVMSRDEARSLDTQSTDVRARLGEAGVALGSDVTPAVLEAAQQYRGLSGTGDIARFALVVALALAGLGWGVRESTPSFRARNSVERGIKSLLILASCIAILTTIGIVLSLVFNTIEFFRIYPARDFFLSTTWSPSFGGGSELGILPLLWGTLYISLIALLVAVPIGLFAAVYLSEYASKRVRSVAKPAIEILAGIPTIVYGLFALLTIGPLLLRVFGDDTVGWMDGGTAVMTAGLAMGIMLIPFVSSLSDDVINAVPQAMRDGSYGLGATQSETIKQVILPAALPGIVGAILLAASRAIGETMIVVLGAGAAARLSLNPFEAMTTVTAKIVSQLTGDADFSSAEALVAFALGMTLFVVTLGLNVLALYIVRKYREQYE
ncbi:phosphate ABC transporter permease [Roseivivax marinus]|jgi:phosphate transport system permease protein|uniref:Phosphate transport system permease protein n=1 Tax=Roseivivax marinus TaxID=1379903 RepID=W4HPN8_9RHOB|nr:phosphate ABC transporter permease subunit PstC [Roseivivax marinus]ETW14368.1 phosphate ABC transporter permease [Roseivivax marinus]SEK79056.1 phosphate ABC transporter membrane protein 1, PhoT family [Roseivivax marinus]